MTFQRPILATAGLLVASALVPSSAGAQLFPWLPLETMPFERQGPVQPIAAREPWSAEDHAGVVAAATSAAAALPAAAQFEGRLRLAATLAAMGDRAAEAEVLRRTAADAAASGTVINGVQARDLASRLMGAGLGDAAQTLAAAAADDPGRRRQIEAGMVEGALKADDPEGAAVILRGARQAGPPAPGFDPLLGQARAVAVALAKRHLYRQALEVYPDEGQAFGASDLPGLARQACAADPTLAARADELLAVAALRIAGAPGVPRIPVDEVAAVAACGGEAAARRLVAAMPPDVAAGLAAATEGAAPDTVQKDAADALAANPTGDRAATDRLLAAAAAALEARRGARGVSADDRRRFDASARQLALALQKFDRPAAAVALVAPLPAVESLPILFALAKHAVSSRTDPGPALDAIADVLAAEPALVRVEAAEIRSLRVALPLGSPIFPRIAPWLERLPPEPEPPRPPRGITVGSGPDRTVSLLLAAAERAAPSIATIRTALEKARRGATASAIAQAKTLVLTPREAGFLDMARAFLRALPADDLAAYGGVLGPATLGEDGNSAVAASSGLLAAIARTAILRGDFDGARQAFEAIPAGAPLRDAAATILAGGEAHAGLPRRAMAMLPQVTAVRARFALLCALAAVRPSQGSDHP